MKKSDLKQNMIVETRDGVRYLVLENVGTLYYGHQELARNGMKREDD